LKKGFIPPEIITTQDELPFNTYAAVGEELMKSDLTRADAEVVAEDEKTKAQRSITHNTKYAAVTSRMRPPLGHLHGES